MKKQLFLVLIAFAMFAFAACDRNGDTQEPTQNEDTPADTIGEQIPMPPLIIEELGSTIVAAGTFWEDWWGMRGIFGHFGESVFIPTDGYGSGMSYSQFLPASGFSTLDDINAYLLQLYTESALAAMYLPFREIDGVLHFADARYGALRPNWETATHTLIEQSDTRAVVETVVYGYDHRGSGDEMPSATLTITLIDGKIDSGLTNWIVDWNWNGVGSDAIIWEAFSAQLDDITLFIDRAENTVLESFDRLYSIDHSILWAGDIEQMVIWATQPIFNASLIYFSNDWDEVAEDIIYILIETYGMADTLSPGEGLHIFNYVSRGTFPWSGISFCDAQGERHFFAINHDNSDSPHRYMMWNITDQMR